MATVWVLTEEFADVDPETTIFESKESAWHDLAERARDGGIPEEYLAPSDTDEALARKMLDFWSECLHLHEEAVR